MPPELPHFALGDTRLRFRIRIVVVLNNLPSCVDFQRARVKAGNTHIKSCSPKGLHLAAQQILVGAGLCEQIVGMDKRAALEITEAVDLDARELRVAALPGCQDAPVAIDQVPVLVDPGWYDPAELVEAPHQLVDLLLRMLLCVPRVGNQLVDLPPYQANHRLCHKGTVLSCFPFCRVRLRDHVRDHMRGSRPRPAPGAKVFDYFSSAVSSTRPEKFSSRKFSAACA